jgi:hypothetical protein
VLFTCCLVSRQGTSSYQYGDMACPMGTSGNAPSCFNPFHSYNLGWTDPVTVLDNDALTPGGWAGLRPFCTSHDR